MNTTNSPTAQTSQAWRRIAVWMLVQARRLGLTDEEIRTRYRPPLKQAELDAAWHYHEAHPSEIEQAIMENEEA